MNVLSQGMPQGYGRPTDSFPDDLDNPNYLMDLYPSEEAMISYLRSTALSPFPNLNTKNLAVKDLAVEDLTAECVAMISDPETYPNGNSIVGFGFSTDSNSGLDTSYQECPPHHASNILLSHSSYTASPAIDENWSQNGTNYTDQIGFDFDNSEFKPVAISRGENVSSPMGVEHPDQASEHSGTSEFETSAVPRGEDACSQNAPDHLDQAASCSDNSEFKPGHHLRGKGGLYYCPHQPCPRKGYQDYKRLIHMDTHIKPYRCGHPNCNDMKLGSALSLIQHEKEIHGEVEHGEYGYGVRPFLCLEIGCPRSEPGYGFPRSFNWRVHMQNVHKKELERVPGAGEFTLKPIAKKPVDKKAIDKKPVDEKATGRKPMMSQTVSRTLLPLGFP